MQVELFKWSRDNQTFMVGGRRWTPAPPPTTDSVSGLDVFVDLIFQSVLIRSRIFRRRTVCRKKKGSFD